MALGKWESAIRLTPERAVLHELQAQVHLEMGATWQSLRAATRKQSSDPYSTMIQALPDDKATPLLSYFRWGRGSLSSEILNLIRPISGVFESPSRNHNNTT